jgi:hypothetical protein
VPESPLLAVALSTAVAVRGVMDGGTVSASRGSARIRRTRGPARGLHTVATSAEEVQEIEHVTEVGADGMP